MKITSMKFLEQKLYIRLQIQDVTPNSTWVVLYFTNLPITGKEGSTLEYLSLDQNSSKSEEVDRSRAMQNDFFPSLNDA